MTKRWLVALGLWAGALSGCNAGTEEACATYACVNTVTLTGSVAVSSLPHTVDASYCVADQCRNATLAVTSGSLNRCSAGSQDVCLEPANGKLRLSVVWHHASNEEPIRGVMHSIQLVDHETGEVLLDEERKADGQITREDNCHRCWSSELTL